MIETVRIFKSIATGFLLAITLTLQARAQSAPPQPSSPQASSPQPSAAPQPEASPKPESSAQSQSAAEAQPTPARTSQTISSLAVYRFVTGKSATYHLEYQSNSKADLRALFVGQAAGQAQASGLSYALTATLQGEMEVTNTHASDERVENFYAFRTPAVRLVVNGNDQTAQANEVSATLAQGFLVELNPEGKVTALYLPPQAGKFSQDFVRTLLATLQFVLAADSPEEPGSWTTTEADRNGPYIARYRITKSANPGRDQLVIHKRKLRYLPASASLSGENLPGKSEARKKVTPKMDFVARFQSATGEMISLVGREVLDTAVEDKAIAHSETTLRLTQVAAPKLSAPQKDALIKAAAALKENSSRLTVFAVKSRTEIEANIQRTELSTATLADLMAQLNALNNNTDPDKRQAVETPVYLKFKALIYVHPESCSQLGQMLAKADVSSPTFRILSGALGAVGHRQAQEALAHAILARRQDSAALPSLIATLGGAPHPTTQSENAVRESALNASDPNVAGAAILALGSMARSLAAAEPGRSTVIVDFLLQRANAGGPSEQRQASLQALGNSASSRALPLLTKMTDDDSPAIRAAAVDALRNIPQPQVDPLLRHVLLTDAEARVRLEAAFALNFRKANLESFTSQKKALAEEKDDKVRGALLDNLAKMHRQFPEVRSILVRAAKEDPSEYVRKEAAGLLGTLQPAAPAHK
ncbi:MAG TPA: HEAT repeat domain-containing protein [Candidatus Angelobacter sp.]|nr:HEAT repeat domain-containing protein [Candidatus Angelobacter sp.]